MTRSVRFVALACSTLALLWAVERNSFAQTRAEQFQQGIPFDSWPSDLMHPLRLLADSVQNNSHLLWVASSGQPPPPGTPPHAVYVLIDKFYRETCWFTNCCVVEVGFRVTIVFQESSGPSKYFYSMLSSIERCPHPDGTRMVAKTQSILSTATVDTWNDVRIQSSFYQLQTSGNVIQFSSDALKVKSAAVNPTAQTLASVSPTVPFTIEAAPGGTLDLQGHDGSAPLCTTIAPVTIHASTIVTDPGVTVSQLFSPPPIVLPAQSEVGLDVALTGYPALQAPAPDVIGWTVTNLGNTSAPISVSWSDTLGWISPGNTIITLDAGESQEVTAPVLYPPSGAPTDHTTATLVATPLSTAGGPASLSSDVYFDSDIDGDGIKNTLDPCAFVVNGTANVDGDFLPDVCDACTSVFNFAPELPTVADFDENGQLAVADIFGFLNAWFAGDQRADADASGGLAVADIFFYLNQWFAGC